MAGGQRWRGEQVSMKRQHCIREKHTLLINQKPSIYRDFHKEKIHDLSFQSQNVWSSCPFSFRTPFKKKKTNKKNCSTYYISDIPLALDCPDKGLSAATSLTTGESGAPLKQ